MTREELAGVWERRMADAIRLKATAPVAQVMKVVLEEFATLDGQDQVDRMMDTNEAGRVLNRAPKTIRRWCQQGRFPGAWQTGGDTGEWQIPSQAVYTLASGSPTPQPSNRPKLWTRPEKGGNR
jgi:hypothetical protein